MKRVGAPTQALLNDYGTQAGYVLAFSDRALAADAVSPWSPSLWRVYRLKRVVPSTLAGETQVAADALGHYEWVLSLVCEDLEADFDPRQRSRSFVKYRGNHV